MNQDAIAPAHYRLNRRAALILGLLFFCVGGVVALSAVTFLSPRRQLQFFRESARGYVDQEMWRQASIQLQNILQRRPDDVEALVELARVKLAQFGQNSSQSAARSELMTATSCLRRAVELEPGRTESHRLLLELALRAGDWSEARRQLNALFEPGRVDPLFATACEMLPPRDPKLLREAAQSLEDGNAAAAVSLLQSRALESPPDLPAVGLLCRSLAHQGDYDDAQRVLDRCAAQLGATATVSLFEAELALAQERWQAVLDRAEPALASSKTAPGAHRLIATAHGKLAEQATQGAAMHWRNAVRHWKSAWETDSGDLHAANNAAWILGAKLEKFEEALAITGVLLSQTQASDPHLLDTHGWLLLGSGQPAKAVLFLERAFAEDPQNKRIRAHLLAAYRESGRKNIPPLSSFGAGLTLEEFTMLPLISTSRSSIGEKHR